jgi:hypothetical protein
MMKPSERLEEKHAANPPSWHTNYRCFFALARYRVVKIVHYYPEVVLQTTKTLYFILVQAPPWR